MPGGPGPWGRAREGGAGGCSSLPAGRAREAGQDAAEAVPTAAVPMCRAARVPSGRPAGPWARRDPSSRCGRRAPPRGAARLPRERNEAWAVGRRGRRGCCRGRCRRRTRRARTAGEPAGRSGEGPGAPGRSRSRTRHSSGLSSPEGMSRACRRTSHPGSRRSPTRRSPR